MNILLVDDEPAALKNIEEILRAENHNVISVEGGPNALAEMEKKPFDLVITDMLMPYMNGIELIEAVKRQYPKIVVLMMTAYGSIENAVEAMRIGAYGYIIKPIDVERTLLEIKKVEEVVKLREQNNFLIQENIDSSGCGHIIGNDPKMLNILETARKVALSNSTVLIEGDTGTGKELIASYIHYSSNRRDKPFVKINCCALSEGILESELFGHERGSFTGAIRDRKGRFELADGGTIFLDEIGDLSPAVQVKLLRVLQEKEFERVGGNRTIKVNVRVITATNKNLEKEVNNSKFRRDLFYRLNVITLKLPPLKNRTSDIPEMANFFLKKYSSEMGKNDLQFSDSAMNLMMNYSWPGNVRELDNVVERSIVLSNEQKIDITDLPFANDNHSDSDEAVTFKEAMNKFEKKFIEDSLAANKFNISKTAGSIKLARTNIYEKIKKHNININVLYDKQ